MKWFAKVWLAGSLAGAAIAGPQDTWFEQWHKAKFGQPSPAETARLQADAANTAYRADPNAAKQTPAPPSWYNDQRFRMKYGRSTPAEEARQDADRNNTAYRDAGNTGFPRTDWTSDYMKAKFNRSPGK